MKKITELFTIKLFQNSAPLAESCSCYIVASNNTKHRMGLSEKSIYLTTTDIREVADFLKETADKIDADKDFNKKKL